MRATHGDPLLEGLKIDTRRRSVMSAHRAYVLVVRDVHQLTKPPFACHAHPFPSATQRQTTDSSSSSSSPPDCGFGRIAVLGVLRRVVESANEPRFLSHPSSTIPFCSPLLRPFVQGRRVFVCFGIAAIKIRKAPRRLRIRFAPTWIANNVLSDVAYARLAYVFVYSCVLPCFALFFFVRLCLFFCLSLFCVVLCNFVFAAFPRRSVFFIELDTVRYS